MQKLHKDGEPGCDCAGRSPTKPDGSIAYHYACTPEEIAAGYIYCIETGPITGSFEVGGHEYDCTEPMIATHPDHTMELLWKIHRAHNERGQLPPDATVPGTCTLDEFIADFEARHAASLAAAAAERDDGDAA